MGKKEYPKYLNYPSGGGKEFHLSRVRKHCVREIGGADPAGAGTREWGPLLPPTLTPKSMQVAPTGELATMSCNISYSLHYLTTCSFTWVKWNWMKSIADGCEYGELTHRVLQGSFPILIWALTYVGPVTSQNSLARGWRSVEFSSSVIRQRDSSKVMNVIKNVMKAFCPRFVVNKQIDVLSMQNRCIKHNNTNSELGPH